MLLLGVHDPHGGGKPGHVADSAESFDELVLLAAHHEQLLLRAAGAGHVVEVDLLELLHTIQAGAHSREVGEHAAQPALTDVGHADALSLLGHGRLSLLLGADEQDVAAAGDGLLDEVVGSVDALDGLRQVDDVDAVALGEDEALHLGVPASGLVAEMDTALQELAHGDNRHVGPFARAPGPPGALWVVGRSPVMIDGAPVVYLGFSPLTGGPTRGAAAPPRRGRADGAWCPRRADARLAGRTRSRTGPRPRRPKGRSRAQVG